MISTWNYAGDEEEGEGRERRRGERERDCNRILVHWLSEDFLTEWIERPVNLWSKNLVIWVLFISNCMKLHVILFVWICSFFIHNTGGEISPFSLTWKMHCKSFRNNFLCLSASYMQNTFVTTLSTVCEKLNPKDFCGLTGPYILMGLIPCPHCAFVSCCYWVTLELKLTLTEIQPLSMTTNTQAKWSHRTLCTQQTVPIRISQVMLWQQMAPIFLGLRDNRNLFLIHKACASWIWWEGGWERGLLLNVPQGPRMKKSHPLIFLTTLPEEKKDIYKVLYQQ